MWIQFVFAALLGLLAGGIVNVLADDLPYRRSIGRPRYADGTPRPLIAWLGITAFLTGNRLPDHPQPEDERSRPHRQGNKLAWRYPLTEIGTAFLLVITTLIAGNEPPEIQLYFYWLYMIIFMLILIIDLEHKLILFVVIIPSILIALADAAFLPPEPIDALGTAMSPSLTDAIIGAVLGFGVFFLLYLGGFGFVKLMNRTRDRDIDEVAFGYGDVMLMTFSGALLGWLPVLFAIGYTVIFGAIGALIYLVAQRILSRRGAAFDAIPYGPYIIAGTLLMLLYGHLIIGEMLY